jgi:NAD-dependent DNA ligase
MTRPLNDSDLRNIHSDRLIDREIDELTGLCKGAILDGSINHVEAEGIMNWLVAHSHCLNAYPANVLYERLRLMLADGLLDSDEEGDLLGLLLRFASPETPEGTVRSALPIDEPPPPITIEGHSFCFTGNFDYGTRTECQAAVNSRGGLAVDSITRKLHYLVIGDLGSEFWKHSSFGHKISKAVEYRERGTPLIIVSEQHWEAHLK